MTNSADSGEAARSVIQELEARLQSIDSLSILAGCLHEVKVQYRTMTLLNLSMSR
uniref:Uncharacterized protein n=1 Tax=Candidatus Kentrum sp. LFY TaxID=2126342 RepID=A0A450UX74_9GAMM|nr:MAG: hypothetical protein BECKLFY1418A_GA0070994_10672 [Candidatus Kentron sp. LFY]